MIKRCLPALLVAAAPAMAAPPDIAVDLPVTGALVSAVATEGTAPVVLTDGATDPLSATLVPDSAPALDRAALIVVMDRGFAPWLERAADLLDPELLELVSVPGTEINARADDYEDGIDPYPWLDPENATRWLGEIAERLSSLDEENAALYRDNAETGVSAIRLAREQVAEAILSRPARPLLAVTEIWAPLAEAFDIDIAGYVGTPSIPARMPSEDDTDPMIALEEPACIIAAPTDDLAEARRVAEANGIEIVQVDPFGGAGAGIDGYTVILRDLAAALRACIPL